jgi:hypothetical protein
VDVQADQAAAVTVDILATVITAAPTSVVAVEQPVVTVALRSVVTAVRVSA